MARPPSEVATAVGSHGTHITCWRQRLCSPKAMAPPCPARGLPQQTSKEGVVETFLSGSDGIIRFRCFVQVDWQERGSWRYARRHVRPHATVTVSHAVVAQPTAATKAPAADKEEEARLAAIRPYLRKDVSCSRQEHHAALRDTQHDDDVEPAPGRLRQAHRRRAVRHGHPRPLPSPRRTDPTQRQELPSEERGQVPRGSKTGHRRPPAPTSQNRPKRPPANPPS